MPWFRAPGDGDNPGKLRVRVSHEEYSGQTRLTPGQIEPYFVPGETNVVIGPISKIRRVSAEFAVPNNTSPFGWRTSNHGTAINVIPLPTARRKLAIRISWALGSCQRFTYSSHRLKTVECLSTLRDDATKGYPPAPLRHEHHRLSAHEQPAVAVDGLTSDEITLN